MHVICITGGPCGGKTTALPRLREHLEAKGFTVFTVPEAATALILAGVEPKTRFTMEAFQKSVMALQIALEDTVKQAASSFGDKAVVLCDRGLADDLAYIPREAYDELLAANALTLAAVYRRYDAVLHFVTAADGAEDSYLWNDPAFPTAGNNAARSESPEQARLIDRRTQLSWIGHPHFRVFGNQNGFERKISAALAELDALLAAQPKEIERKFVCDMPDLAALRDNTVCSDGDTIEQIMLTRREKPTERRIRRRGSEKNGYTCYYTEKIKIREGERYESESVISEETYRALLAEADPSLPAVHKTRYCFLWQDRLFELDVYPFDTTRAILEAELHALEEIVDLPPFLHNVRDVTGVDAYKNLSLAARGAFPAL